MWIQGKYKVISVLIVTMIKIHSKNKNLKEIQWVVFVCVTKYVCVMFLFFFFIELVGVTLVSKII